MKYSAFAGDEWFFDVIAVDEIEALATAQKEDVRITRVVLVSAQPQGRYEKS